jgi:hypothetical protein
MGLYQPYENTVEDAVRAAFRYRVYSLVSVSIEEHRALLGNIGNGANGDAVVNIKKKIIRIDVPLIVKLCSRNVLNVSF